MPSEHSEQVILVDEHDREQGSAEKLWVHEQARLHRAFSVFVLNRRGELLLQRRAAVKYHSPGLWTNTCCGHPRPGEETADAARRRLQEEMGFACELTHLFGFRYRAEVGGGLVENEYDHVFLGRCEAEPRPDPAEVHEWRWAMPAAVEQELRAHPERFTRWFPPAFQGLLRHLRLREQARAS